MFGEDSGLFGEVYGELSVVGEFLVVKFELDEGAVLFVRVIGGLGLPVDGAGAETFIVEDEEVLVFLEEGGGVPVRGDLSEEFVIAEVEDGDGVVAGVGDIEAT